MIFQGLNIVIIKNNKNNIIHFTEDLNNYSFYRDKYNHDFSRPKYSNY
jgi:hypothetical protein